MNVHYKFASVLVLGIFATACGLGADESKSSSNPTSAVSAPLQIVVAGGPMDGMTICPTGEWLITGTSGGASVEYTGVLTDADCDDATLLVALDAGSYTFYMGTVDDAADPPVMSGNALVCYAPDTTGGTTVWTALGTGFDPDYLGCEFSSVDADDNGVDDGVGFVVTDGVIANIDITIQINFEDENVPVSSVGAVTVELDPEFVATGMCNAAACPNTTDVCLTLAPATVPACYSECTSGTAGAVMIAVEEDTASTYDDEIPVIGMPMDAPMYVCPSVVAPAPTGG